jgi:nucleoside phosphorylase
LIKDSRIVKEWLKHARDLGAVEMELAGVQAAANRLKKQYPVICIRCLSDIVGYEREPGWTHYACESGAAFCIWLLKHMPGKELDLD